MSLDVGESDDLDVVYDDCGIAATYRGGGEHSVDVGTLSESGAFTETSVTVVRDAKREEELVMQGRAAQGSRVFRVRASELSAEPAADDELGVGSVTWQVDSWGSCGSELEYELHCRRVG